MSARRSALPDTDPTAAPTVRDAAKVVAWGLVFWAAVELASTLFQNNETAAVAVQAALAEWGAGRMAIAWSDPLAPPQKWAAIGRRAGRGAALGAVAAALVVAVARATRGASATWAAPAASAVVVGLIVSALSAVRDELLLRGVVLRATRGLLPTWTALVACGAAAAAARFGAGDASAIAVAAEGARGVALGALWTRDRGAWMAVAANTAWTWCLGSLARGGVLDVRFAVPPEAGLPALAVLGAAAAAALFWTLRRPPTAASPGAAE